MDEFLVSPADTQEAFTQPIRALDQSGAAIDLRVPIERPRTLYLNGQEIVTMMTIGDHPECLAVGYLINQNMLTPADEIIGIDVDLEIDVVVVRTGTRTSHEEKLRKKTLTSGCAQGTAFGDLMERFDTIRLDPDATVRTSWLIALSKKINTHPSIYLAAGSVHGVVLCEEDRPLAYMEDVGRHNAIDKIAGWMRLNAISPRGKLIFTTGRLTSEMVIKCVQMEIPVLVSRNGFTAWGVELAQRANLTLIGRAKGSRFIAVAGTERIQFDTERWGAAPDPAKGLCPLDPR
jgi:FdhD protein